jgi:hypothetical protein
MPILSHRLQSTGKQSAISREDTTVHESVTSKYGSFLAPARAGDDHPNFKRSILAYQRPSKPKKAQSFGKLDFAKLASTQSQSFRKLDYGACMNVLKNTQRYRNALAEQP